MKTIKFLFPAMFIAFVMAACNGPRKDSTEKADSVNSKYDSLNNKDTGTGDRALSGPMQTLPLKQLTAAWPRWNLENWRSKKLHMPMSKNLVP
jgi:hypothetical protein